MWLRTRCQRRAGCHRPSTPLWCTQMQYVQCVSMPLTHSRTWASSAARSRRALHLLSLATVIATHSGSWGFFVLKNWVQLNHTRNSYNSSLLQQKLANPTCGDWPSSSPQTVIHIDAPCTHNHLWNICRKSHTSSGKWKEPQCHTPALVYIYLRKDGPSK